MTMAVLCCLAFAFLLSVGLTPVVRATVLRLGLVDAAGRSHRKIHANDIPRLGGIAIVLAFFIPLGAAALLLPGSAGVEFLGNGRLEAAFFAGAAAIAALGVYDDTVGATPRQKLAVQLLVATMVVAAGFKIGRIDPPFLRGFELGFAAYPITIVWIVGVTNAVNLIDGLDGLAAGVSLIAVLPVAAIGIVSGQVALSLIAFSFIGALAGFLVHNFHPAKIFMGDTGSMFLGFVLAVVTVQVTQKTSVVASLAAPMLALALPILDTLTAMARRAFLGKPVFSPDREHFHHRFMRLGLSHRSVVLAMYGVGFAFASLAMIVLFYRGLVSGVALVLSGLLTALLLRRLGYFGAHADLIAAVENGLAARRRNRALYGQLAEFKRLAQTDAALDSLAEALLALARVAGATWVRLSVPAVGTFESGTGLPVEPLSFMIGDGESEFGGALLCCWPAGGNDSVVLHVMETAREAFEQRLTRAAPNLEPARAA